MLMLGHHTVKLTMQHYINAPAALQNATANMPQPAWIGGDA
jgi:hypothetical protein